MTREYVYSDEKILRKRWVHWREKAKYLELEVALLKRKIKRLQKKKN